MSPRTALLSSDLVSAHSEAGQRDANEDSTLTLINEDGTAALLVVADGMGGQAHGEAASRIAVKVFETFFAEEGFATPAESLDEAMSLAQGAILEGVQRDPAKTGMGTTVVAAIVTPSEVHVAHVGDSRALQFRGDTARRLTRDHLFVIDTLGIPENKAKAHRMGNVLSQVVGGEDGIRPTISEFDVQSSDTIVLVSDGISDKVTEDRMYRILQSLPIRSAARELVDAALRSGSQDNCSAVVLKVP
jgi:serine/threonine protein phosphatase PrpC